MEEDVRFKKSVHMVYNPQNFDPDVLFAPLVVGVPQETATYLELADSKDANLSRLILRAKFYELSGRDDLALAIYDRVLSSGRYDEIEGGAWFCKGMLLAAQDDARQNRHEIVSCFCKAIECAIPSSLRSRIHTQLGMCQIYTFSDRAAGLKSMRDALNEPEAPSFIKGVILQHLAAAAQEAGEYADAVGLYGQALKEQLSQNARASVLANLGRIYRDVYGDDAVAFDYWRQAQPLFCAERLDYDKTDEQHCQHGLRGKCYQPN